MDTWLQEQASVDERVLSSLKVSEYDPGNSDWDFKRTDPKDRSSNFEAVVSDKMSFNQRPLQDDVSRIWQCEVFKKKSVDDRSKVVK